MNEDVVLVELTDIARTELAQRAELVLPPAHRPAAVQRDRLRAEGRLARHLDVRPVHVEQRAACREPSVAPGSAQPQFVVGGRVGPDERLILVDAAGLRRIAAGVRVGEQGDFLVGADPEVVAAADAVSLGASEIGARLLTLLDAKFEMGLSGQPARLIGSCRMVSVDEWLIGGVRG